VKRVAPGGGISLDGSRGMRYRKSSFFLPVRLLNHRFRKIFLRHLKPVDAALSVGASFFVEVCRKEFGRAAPGKLGKIGPIKLASVCSQYTIDKLAGSPAWG
jgi:hypothetical protein